MDKIKEHNLRNDFKSILYDLAKSQTILQTQEQHQQFYIRLETLYCSDINGKKFRHYYSDIFSTLTTINQNEELGNINILGENISILFTKYVPSRHNQNDELLDIRVFRLFSSCL